MRKILALTADYAQMTHIDGWRQSKFNIRQVKRAYRAAQQIKRSSSKDEARKQKQQNAIVQTHQDYIDLVRQFIHKSETTLATEVTGINLSAMIKALEIQAFIDHAQRQINQIERRVIKNEKIPAIDHTAVPQINIQRQWIGSNGFSNIHWHRDMNRVPPDGQNAIWALRLCC